MGMMATSSSMLDRRSPDVRRASSFHPSRRPSWGDSSLLREASRRSSIRRPEDPAKGPEKQAPKDPGRKDTGRIFTAAGRIDLMTIRSLSLGADDAIMMEKLIIIVVFAGSFLFPAVAQEDQVSYWIGQGETFRDQYRFEEALQAFDKATQLDNTSVAAWAGRASSLNHLGRKNESLQAYDAALALAPGYIRALVGKAGALFDLNQTNQSLQTYDAALELDPTYSMAYNDKAWELYKLGRYNDSSENADRALYYLYLDLSATLDTKAMALAGMGRFEEALDDLNRSLELDPTTAETWIHKGDVLEALGRKSEAELAYSKANTLPMSYLGGENL
jgi:Flp pilus assembly protein TadD